MAYGAQFMNSSGGVVFDSSYPALGVIKKQTIASYASQSTTRYLYTYPGSASPIATGVSYLINVPTIQNGINCMPLFQLPSNGDYCGPDSRYGTNDGPITYRSNLSSITFIWVAPMNLLAPGSSAYGVECWDESGALTYSSDQVLFFVRGSLASDNPPVGQTGLAQTTVGSSDWFCMENCHHPMHATGNTGIRNLFPSALRRQSSTIVEKRNNYSGWPNTPNIPASQYRDNWGLHGLASAV